MAVHLNDGYVKVLRDNLELYRQTQEKFYKAEAEYERCRHDYHLASEFIIDHLLMLALNTDKPEKPA